MPNSALGTAHGRADAEMTEALQPILVLITEVVDLIGLAIVLFGAAKFLIMYAQIEAKRLRGRSCTVKLEAARQALGGYILIALEFMVVSDVINSVVSRSMESLASLGVIVGLRTAMGFFLARELDKDEADPTLAGEGSAHSRPSRDARPVSD